MYKQETEVNSNLIDNKTISLLFLKPII